jgi:hypothetical protein
MDSGRWPAERFKCKPWKTVGGKPVGEYLDEEVLNLRQASQQHTKCMKLKLYE